MDENHQPLPEARQPLVRRTLAEWRTLAILGGPILIAQVAQMANGVIDTVMAGHASARDLAAVGIGSSLWMPLFLFFMGMLGALQPIISGYNGARQHSKIMPATWQGIYIAAGGTVIMALLLTNVHPVLAMLKMDTETAGITQGYLNAFAWGIPALLLMNALRGLTDGLGHTRVIMAFSVLSTLINLPLNYIFIYGKLGLPAMGGVGCGWATSLSNGTAAIALLIYLNRSRTFRQFHLLADWVKPNWRGVRYILGIGVPIGFTIFVEASMFSVIALFLAPLGPVIVAGHQIALNVVSLLFMLPLSIGMALTLRVSFLVGARAPDTARLISRSSLILASAVALIFATLLFVFSAQIAALYTGDQAVRDVTIRLLAFAAMFQVADVIQVTCISALRGYKDTRIPMFIMLFSFWGVGLPLGYILTFTDLLWPALGAAGFWVGLTAGLTSASVLLGWRLFRYRPGNHHHGEPDSRTSVQAGSATN
ncbi:MATE family efflux transporter [Marinobacter excellens]|jgi:MATE family multidrug resistance protein|uniref:Multidrug-efflux transporter n=2 Tax=Marinobacter TaxID=2742 RepID=A0A455W7B5_MARNT|nr:MATE family efflux transporter [Marinobacter excellens]KXO10709.1 Multi antimicrobial extrusion protein (Na(+)/drug antiporter, MATE family of MDR efflux pump) [Marinobacter excellens LAMA 842]KXO11373.1 Multi antimicrobial extrusion protein (Na(+)/drug antiporter, MATE family of MDR efflux pump) [Marinobacter excellens LAMA 842]BBJ02455.1 MATE family efflux transporter [Marinobacter nauticus]